MKEEPKGRRPPGKGRLPFPVVIHLVRDPERLGEPCGVPVEAVTGVAVVGLVECKRNGHLKNVNRSHHQKIASTKRLISMTHHTWWVVWGGRALGNLEGNSARNSPKHDKQCRSALPHRRRELEHVVAEPALEHGAVDDLRLSGGAA